MSAPTPEHPRRVLLVDDEHVIADTLSLIFQHAGYETATAYNGRQAVEIARSFLPDIVISDIIMADMDGIEAAIHIQRDVPQCRIFLISGQAASPPLADRARRDGHAFPLIAKPINPQELLARVAQLDPKLLG